jgi:predicted RNA binding protein YcfA (HicA-like mRNA interferase family)
VSRLARISGRDLQRVLERKDFVFMRQKGSHIMMRRMRRPSLTVSIPDHKELAPGILRAILRDAGISADELAELI